jgi:hypothetical protein
MHEKHHPLDAAAATAGGMMVICDKCPCLNLNDDYWSGSCNISGESIARNKYDKPDFSPNNCPLSRIELKDGTIFKPEEA